MSENRSSTPEAHTGSPQAAEAEATGKPTGEERPAIKPVSIDKIKIGERFRTAGLLWQMEDDWGGGYLRLRPASVTAVSSARDDHERKIRKVPKVKRRYKPNENLTGKPGTELNRFTVVMAAVEWITEAPLEVGGELIWPHEMEPDELRLFIAEHFLPELDLTSDAPPEDELNMTFLQHVLEGLEEVSRVPAQEIAAVGKDFKLGLGGGISYSD